AWSSVRPARHQPGQSAAAANALLAPTSRYTAVGPAITPPPRPRSTDRLAVPAGSPISAPSVPCPQPSRHPRGSRRRETPYPGDAVPGGRRTRGTPYPGDAVPGGRRTRGTPYPGDAVPGGRRGPRDLVLTAGPSFSGVQALLPYRPAATAPQVF